MTNNSHRPAAPMSDLNNESKTITFADSFVTSLDAGAAMSPRFPEACANMAAHLRTFGTPDADAAAARLDAAIARRLEAE